MKLFPTTPGERRAYFLFFWITLFVWTLVFWLGVGFAGGFSAAIKAWGLSWRDGDIGGIAGSIIAIVIYGLLPFHALLVWTRRAGEERL